MKVLVGITRIFVGVFFIISGFIKLNDPIGFAFKLEEYFGPTVLDLPFFTPYALMISVFVVVFEVLLGIFLIFAYKPKFTIYSLLVMIVFFTFLTWYSAYFNKVKDCGCFGDAMKMEPWESFGKDVVLLVLILILVAGLKYIKPFFGKFVTTIISLLGFIGCLGFAYYVLMHLPVIDFRPYKVGDNIIENMTIPENAPKAVSEYRWKFKVNGEEKIITTNGAYPTVNGDFIGVETEIIEEGYEAPIHDFSIERNGEDATESLLLEEHLIMIVAYNLEKANVEGLERIKVIADKAIRSGYKVIGLTATGPEEQGKYNNKYGLNFDFYFCDETALKTIVRSNPAVLKLNKGTIIQKLHFNDLDELILTHLPNANPNLDVDLKRKLDSIMILDQKYRKEDYHGNAGEQDAIDRTNLSFIESIFKTKGYPGKSIVGEKTNEVAWYVVQHSDKIPDYLPLIKEAATKGELSYKKVAMMEDRYLMHQNKEQIYGTQGMTYDAHSDTPFSFIWPIKDFENVNLRRKEIGYTDSVEDYSKALFGNEFVFKNYTIEDIANRKK